MSKKTYIELFFELRIHLIYDLVKIFVFFFDIRNIIKSRLSILFRNIYFSNLIITSENFLFFSPFF